MERKTLKEGDFKLVSEYVDPLNTIRLFKNSDGTFTVEDIHVVYDDEDCIYIYYECPGSGPALERFTEQVFRRVYRLELSDIDIKVD